MHQINLDHLSTWAKKIPNIKFFKFPTKNQCQKRFLVRKRSATYVQKWVWSNPNDQRHVVKKRIALKSEWCVSRWTNKKNSINSQRCVENRRNFFLKITALVNVLNDMSGWELINDDNHPKNGTI